MTPFGCHKLGGDQEAGKFKIRDDFASANAGVRTCLLGLLWAVLDNVSLAMFVAAPWDKARALGERAVASILDQTRANSALLVHAAKPRAIDHGAESSR